MNVWLPLSILLAVFAAHGERSAESQSAAAPFDAASEGPSHLDGAWAIAAEASYRLFNESCGKTQAGDPPSEAAQAEHLSNLAAERVMSVDCQHTQIAAMRADKALVAGAADDLATKLNALMDAHQTAARQEAQLKEDAKYGFANGSATYKAHAEAYKNTLAAEQETLASIQFIQVPKIREFVKAQLAMSGDRTGTQYSPEQIRSFVAQKFPAALAAAETDLASTSQTLHRGVETKGASLDGNTRETLAQDSSLVSVMNTRSSRGPDDKAIACAVDSRYGKGAKNRDGLMVAAQVGLGVASMGASAYASAAVRAGTLRGAVNAGEIAVHRANILSMAALATDVTAGALQTAKECAHEPQMHGTQQQPEGKTCGKFKLEDIERDNCYLTAGLNLLGAAAMTPKMHEYIGLLRKPKMEGLATRLGVGENLKSVARQVETEMAADPQYANQFKMLTQDQQRDYLKFLNDQGMLCPGG